MLQTTALPETVLLPAGATSDLPAGGRKLVFVPGGESLLLLNVEGAFHALENSCPHAGASMASGSCEGHVLSCPAHGLRFDVRSGACTASAAMAIPVYEVQEREGLLWIRLPAAAAQAAD